MSDAEDILENVYAILTDPYSDAKLDAIAEIEKHRGREWQRNHHGDDVR
jgi:hypothetical protein